MILKKASRKAIKYACMNYHYAKVVPVTANGYNVFNNNGEWCGVILYGSGASPYMGSPYGLVQGQYLELVRMALNGKQDSTSKAMSISIKLVKKHNPTLKLLISYADKGQNHYGTIYQATNWYFVEETESSGTEMFYKGRWTHPRTPSALPKEQRDRLPKRKMSGKRKYLYPLTKDMRQMCEDLAKPYPKNAREV